MTQNGPNGNKSPNMDTNKLAFTNL